MPSILSLAVPALALAGSAIANPLKRDDACLAAVTGKAALGDESLRKFHCSSFIKTIVTPAAITVTTTITDAPAPITGKPKFKRDVTVCPNEVPNYASACDNAGYKSACKAFGISSETTYTIPATTTTKTVYAGYGTCTGGTATVTSTVGTATVTSTSTVTIATGPYGTGLTTYTNGQYTTTVSGGFGGFFSGTGPVSTVTSTVTVTAGAATVTAGGATVTAGGSNTTVTTTVIESVTATGAGSVPAGPSGVGKCVTKDRADALVAGFINLLEYTSYAGDNYTHTPPGRGYNYNVSADIFDPNFFDVSDSINWMAGFELGTVTFPSKAAFDYGQGVLQPEVQAQAIKIWYGCNTITWRWLLTPFTGAQVRGINHFVLNSDGTKILENYAEFDNAAWLSSYGLQCKLS